MALRYQDIEVMLRQENVGPNTVKVIQHLHAENVGLKQEITGICRGLDRLVETINSIAVVAGAHQQIFKGLEEGKSMSDIISEMRSEHLSGVVSEEVK